MRTLIAFVILALVFAASGAPSSLTYKVGDFFAYTFSSQVQTGTQKAPGALSTMSGTVEVACQSINDKGNYLFAMNMFDVEVDASNTRCTPILLLLYCLNIFTSLVDEVEAVSASFLTCPV